MINRVPLDAIIDCTDNIYKMATIAIKEAERLGKDGFEKAEKAGGDAKVVSIALDNTFNGRVRYKENCEKFLRRDDVILSE